MFTHLGFEKPSDLEDVRAKLRRLDGKRIAMRCHYAEASPSYSDDWLKESEHYSNHIGIPQEEGDKSFTLKSEMCEFRNIDTDIAEMQPHIKGEPFFRKYVSVQIITTE